MTDDRPTDTGAHSAVMTEDGTRRTRLANERTLLAWWRSGFAAFAVSLGAGKFVPALTHATPWPYLVLGAGFAFLGVAFIGYGLVRQQMVDRAITHGSFSRADDKVIAVLAATGMLLGVLLLVLVAAD